MTCDLTFALAHCCIQKNQVMLQVFPLGSESLLITSNVFLKWVYTLSIYLRHHFSMETWPATWLYCRPLYVPKIPRKNCCRRSSCALPPTTKWHSKRCYALFTPCTCTCNINSAWQGDLGLELYRCAMCLNKNIKSNVAGHVAHRPRPPNGIPKVPRPSLYVVNVPATSL